MEVITVFNSFDATISSATFKAKNTKGAIRRSCELTLETDFSSDIAAGIGKEAKRWRADLKSSALEQAKIPISAVACTADFTTPEGEDHAVPIARGVSAIGVMSESSDEDPRIKIKLGFQLNSADAAWFPMQLGNVVTVKLTKTQLTLLEGAADGEEKQQAAV
jgi:hypothetical protein